MSHKARVIAEYPCREDSLHPERVTDIKAVKDHVEIILDYEKYVDWGIDYVNYFILRCGYGFSPEDYKPVRVIAEDINNYIFSDEKQKIFWKNNMNYDLYDLQENNDYDSSENYLKTTTW